MVPNYLFLGLHTLWQNQNGCFGMHMMERDMGRVMPNSAAPVGYSKSKWNYGMKLWGDPSNNQIAAWRAMVSMGENE